MKLQKSEKEFIETQYKIYSENVSIFLEQYQKAIKIFEENEDFYTHQFEDYMIHYISTSYDFTNIAKTIKSLFSKEMESLHNKFKSIINNFFFNKGASKFNFDCKIPEFTGKIQLVDVYQYIENIPTEDSNELVIENIKKTFTECLSLGDKTKLNKKAVEFINYYYVSVKTWRKEELDIGNLSEIKSDKLNNFLSYYETKDPENINLFPELVIKGNNNLKDNFLEKKDYSKYKGKVQSVKYYMNGKVVVIFSKEEYANDFYYNFMNLNQLQWINPKLKKAYYMNTLD
jgi:hypothetical protein